MARPNILWLVGDHWAFALAANAVAARYFLHENVDHRRWLATIFVCGGVAMLTRS